MISSHLQTNNSSGMGAPSGTVGPTPLHSSVPFELSNQTFITYLIGLARDRSNFLMKSNYHSQGRQKISDGNKDAFTRQILYACGRALGYFNTETNLHELIIAYTCVYDLIFCVEHDLSAVQTQFCLFLFLRIRKLITEGKFGTSRDYLDQTLHEAAIPDVVQHIESRPDMRRRDQTVTSEIACSQGLDFFPVIEKGSVSVNLSQREVEVIANYAAKNIFSYQYLWFAIATKPDKMNPCFSKHIRDIVELPTWATRLSLAISEETYMQVHTHANELSEISMRAQFLNDEAQEIRKLQEIEREKLENDERNRKRLHDEQELKKLIESDKVQRVVDDVVDCLNQKDLEQRSCIRQRLERLEEVISNLANSL